MSDNEVERIGAHDLGGLPGGPVDQAEQAALRAQLDCMPLKKLRIKLHNPLDRKHLYIRAFAKTK